VPTNCHDASDVCSKIAQLYSIVLVFFFFDSKQQKEVSHFFKGKNKAHTSMLSTDAGTEPCCSKEREAPPLFGSF
jgi:hypothetical protein